MPDAAVLLDLDGCLVDSLPSIARCWAQTLAETGRPPVGERELRPLLGPPADWVARQLAPDADDAQIAALVAGYRARSQTLQVAEVAAYDGAPEMLDALRARGLTLALATSKSEETARPLLERLGLADRFAAIHGTPPGETGTAKRTVVSRAIAAVAPLRVLAHVGDRSQDVDAALHFGLAAIGVAWGYAEPGELERAGATAIAHAPAEVPGLIESASA